MSKKPTKIFYIGLSRSGTTSLHHILLELGLESVHFCNFLLSNEPHWEKCDQFDALGDSPIPLLFKELDSRYPDSKFILTIRQKEKWLESMEWMFKHGKVIWDWNESIHAYHEKFYGSRSFNKRILSRHYDDYHKSVFDYFSASPDKLFTIKLEDGFDVNDICAFLNIPPREVTNDKRNSRVNASHIGRIEYNVRYYVKRALKLTKSFIQRR